MTGHRSGAPPGKGNGRLDPEAPASYPDTTPATNQKSPLTIRQGTDEKRRSCRHVQTRFCPSCVVERRRASDELNAMYPRPPRVPCTFGLEPRELRAHARELRLAGWTNGELRQVLAVEPTP
jgi:hypothetical protein